MSKSARGRRWTGWSSRKPSLLRPFPSLRCEELEVRDTPAVTYTWTGMGGNNLWSTPANWSSSTGTAPTGVPGNQEELVFGLGAAQRANQNDISGGVYNSITLSDSNYTITGNSITLGLPGISGGTFTVTGGSTGNTWALPTALGASTASVQTFTVGAGGDVNFTSNITGTTGATLTKDGPGILRFSADNSGFTGPITLRDNGGVLVIANPNALGDLTNGTTVGQNASLQVATGAGTVRENLVLNGPGVSNAGALNNVGGTNTWAGTIRLDSDTTLGATQNTVLDITGVVSDSSSGFNLTKEGAGEVKLDSPTGNTYRRRTIVNNGILTAGTATALGPVSGSDPNAGTLVTKTLTQAGQLRLSAVNGTGFTVFDEYLELNGDAVSPGFAPALRGALANFSGDNVWAGPVVLGSPVPDGRDVTVGAAANTSVTIHGVVSSPNRTANFNPQLIKVGPGRLVMTNANTYTGFTDVREGSLTIRDSSALGAVGQGTRVADGATLELDVEAAYVGTLPQTDPYGRDLGDDSITHDPLRLTVSEPLFLTGRGFNNTGALRSVSGINRYLADIRLGAEIDTQTAIGVDPDRRPGHPTADFSYFVNDFSLTVGSPTPTVVGGIFGNEQTDFVKRGTGQLILPIANAYTGLTQVEQGWVTIQNNRALGADIVPITTPTPSPNVTAAPGTTPPNGRSQTAQPGTYVSAGAAVHVRPFTPGTSLSIPENINLAGTGITHPYAFISQKGALMNLDGDNKWTYDVGFTGQAGIGVEQVVNPNNVSELTVTGSTTDGNSKFNLNSNGGQAEQAFLVDTGVTQGTILVTYDMYTIPDRLNIYYGPRAAGGTQVYASGSVSGSKLVTVNYGPGPGTVVELVMNQGGGNAGTAWNLSVAIPTTGGLVKLGSKRLTLQGDGTYSGATELREGTLRDQNDTALGLNSTGTATGQEVFNTTDTTVAAGAVLEMQKGLAQNNGGVAAGIQTWNERLVLNAAGQQVSVAGAGGTFDLTFNGLTTPSLPITANAAQVQAALEPLVSDVQTLTVLGPAGSTFTVTYNGQTTVPLPFGIPATGGTQPTDSLQNALNSLPNVGPVGGDVAVTRTAVAGGYTYTLTFLGSLAGLDVNPVTAAGGGGATTSAATVRNGFGAPLRVTQSGNVFTVVFGGSMSPDVPMLTATPVGGAEVRISGGNAPLQNLADDNAWRGPVTLNEGSRVNVGTDARLSLLGNIDDASNAQPAGSDFTKRGTGELVLGGANTYRGTTLVDAGIATAMSNTAFGGTAGGTVVSNGAQIQLHGSLSIAGEALTVRGSGPAGVPNFAGTVRWLNAGPSPTNNGISTNNLPTTGRVTDVATDPSDPNVIYVATAGGGAWKTKNGGVTWEPLFDSPFDQSAVMFGGAIAVSPSNPDVVYFATGEGNAGPNGLNIQGTVTNYAGTGVYRSGDGGKTWTLLTDSATNLNPLFGAVATKLVVDPENENRFYVATGAGSTQSPYGPYANLQNQDGSPTAVPGVYRGVVTTATGSVTGTAFLNLTGTPSAARATAAAGPGPEDSFSLGFPQSNATWSDILLVKRGNLPPGPPPGPSEWVLYAALGDSRQRYVAGQTPATQGIFNAVYRTEDPDVTTGNGSIWWLGQGTAYPRAGIQGPPPVNQPIVPPTVPNSGVSGGFPIGPTTPPTDNTPLRPGRNGWIKLAGATTRFYVNPLSSPNANAVMTISAVVTKPYWDPLKGELLSVEQTGWDGGINTGWLQNPVATQAAFPTRPFGTAVQDPNNAGPYYTNMIPALGRYDSAFIAQDSDPRSIGDNNSSVLYLAGLDSIYQSTDAGVTWSIVNGANYPAKQFHALNMDTSGRIVTGSDGGVWRYDGTTFNDLNGDLSVTQLNSADPYPTDVNRAVAGAADNGIQAFGPLPFGTNATSPAWRRVDAANPAAGSTLGTQAGVVRYDTFDPTVIYAVKDGTLRKSTDSGQNWVTLRNVSNFAALMQPIINLPYPVTTTEVMPPVADTNYFPLVLDSQNRNRVVIGGPATPLGLPDFSNTPPVNTLIPPPIPLRSGLYESTNGGASFVDLNANNNGTLLDVTAVGLATFQGTFVRDPAFLTVTDKLSNTYDPNTVYVTDGTVLALTKNRGVSWVTRTPPVGATGAITDIAVDPANRDHVYVTVRRNQAVAGGRVYETTDAGRTWTNISGNLPLLPTWKVAVDPRNGQVYVGNDNGVWTAAGGTTAWSRVGAGLPVVQVRDIVLSQNLNTLTVATNGRGMYQLLLPSYEANAGALRAVSGASVWTGPVTLTGPTTLGADGTQNIQNGIAAASLNIIGVISDSVPGSANTLTKVGPGTITFSGANTYGGQTLVREGVLQVNNKDALGDSVTGDTVVIPTSINGRPALAALELRSDLEAEPVTINGDGFSFNGHNTGALRNVANNNTYTGRLTFGTDTTIGVDSNSTLTIGARPGVLAGTGFITDGANSFSFDKELPGTLVLGTLGVPAPAGSQNTYDGLTRVVQGALRVQDDNALGNPATGTLVMDGAALEMAGSVTVSGEALSLSGTGVNGTGALRNVSGNNTYQGGVTFTNTPNFSPATNPGSQIAVGVDVLGDTLTINTPIAENAAAEQFGLIKVGSGTLVLPQNNNFSGVTNIDGGTVRVRANGALGPVVSSEVQRVSVVGTAGTFQLVFNGQVTAPINANAATPTAFAGAVQAALAALPTVGTTGGVDNVLVSATRGVNGYVLTITFRGPLKNLDQPEIRVANASAGLQVTVSTDQEGGLGTVVAAGATLELDGTASALNPTEVLTLNGDGVNGTGALTNAANNNSYSGPVTIGSDATLGAAAGTTLTVTQPLQDPTPMPVPAPRLRKAGAGTVVLPTAENYAGRTVIDEGVLRITNPQALGTGRTEVQTVSVFANSGQFTLTFNGATTAPLAVGVPASGGATATDSVQNALNALPTIGGVGGNVTVTSATVNGGTVYTVTFGGTLLNQNVPQLLTQTTVGSVITGTTTQGTGSEIQTVDVVGTSGTFTLTFNGQTTVALPFDVLASGGAFPVDSVKNALDALSNIGGIGGSVSVYKTPIPGGTRYTITFGGALANQNVNQITGSGSGGAAVTSATSQNGAAANLNEVQTALVTASSGTFTLTFDGQTTVPVAFNVPAAGGTLPADSLQNALNALTSVNRSEIQTVQVNGSGGTFTMTFNGQTTVPLPFNAPAVGGLNPTDSVQNALQALTSVRRSEVQQIQTTGGTGSFTLTFNGQTTGTLAANVPASGGVGPTASVENALNALLSIGGVGGSATVTQSGPLNNRTYTVTFGGTLANTNVATLGAAPVGGLVANVVTVQDGLGGTVGVTATPVPGGTLYTLTFGGELANANLPQTAAAGSGGATTAVRTVQDGFTGNVTVTSAAVTGGRLYTITFGGALANTNVPQITAPLIVADTVRDGLGSEVQQALITGSSGTFTLTFNGQTTTPLPFNAPAAQVQAALNALSSVGRAEVQDVTVSGIGGTFTLTFNGQTTAPLPFDATAAQVQAALNQLASVARSEVQTVTITGLPGTFTLTFNGQTTAPLPYNATAAQVQAALNALSSFGTIGGTATVTSTPVAGGTQYAIAFGATLANYDQPQITATTTGAISAAVATPTQGLGGTTVVTAAPVSGGIRYRVTFGGVLGNSDLPPMAAAGAGGATAGVAPVQDGGGAGSVTVTRSVIAGGYDYTIAFGGNLANANQPQISVATVGGNAGRVVTTLDGPEGTTVNPGATLQVAGGITMPANTGEVVTINGPGFGTLGALDSAGGNNTWATPLYLGSDASIGTATAADTLTFTAPIVDNVPNNPSPFNLSVVGPGTVVYNATVDNQYTGTTTVLGGVLLLSQASGTAIVGPLVIGTGPDPAKVLYDVNSSNQIADDAPVAVDFNGTLDLAGNSDAIDALTVRSGLVLTGPGGVLAPNSVSMTGGTIAVGAGGTLRMNGNLFAISTGTTPARINGTGNLDLNGTDRAFNVANGPGVDDLVISSGVVATGGGRLVKTGAGRLTFDPTTPVTATVTSQGGDVRVLTAIGSVELATGSLSGSGTVTRITGAGGNGPAVGRIDPGVDGTGVLTSTGPVTWGANTRLFLNLDAVNHPVPIVGVEYDQFRVTGTGDITLGGAVLDGTVAAGVQVGDKFTVVDATGTTGRVIGRFAEPFGPGVVFIGGQKFTVDYSDPQKVVLTRVLAAVTVGLSSSANPSATGQPVTFTATVTPEPGSGSIPPGTTVVFTFDSTNSPAIPVTVLPNGTGTASWTPPVSLLTNGSHTVTALFSGDSVLFGAATAAPLTQVVNTVVIAPITLTPTSPTANVPFISPSITPGVQDGITISTAVSGQLSPLTWTVRIAQGATTVRTYTGTSGPLSGNTTYPISVTWDGRNTGGAFVADGAYTVTASFTDANSNTGTTAPATVRVDNTRPVPSAVTSSETIINAGPTAGQVPVSTRLTGSVSEANLDTWTLAVKNSLGATVRTFTGTTTAVDVTWDGKDTGGAVVADDTYTFSLTAIDKAGNPSAAAGAGSVVVLSTGPSVALSTNSPTIYGQAITLTAVVSEPIPSVANNLVGDTVRFFQNGNPTPIGSAPIAFNGSQYVASITLNSPTYGAGQYTFTATYLDTPEFLASSSGPVAHTVTRATLAVRADAKSKVYGAPVPPLTYTVTGLQYSDTAGTVLNGGSLSTTATPASAVGSYPITQGSLALTSGNYNLVFTGANLTITPAALTVTATSQTRTYGDPLVPLAYQVSGLTNNDTAAGVLSGGLGTSPTLTQASPAGVVNVTQGTLVANNNYTLAFVPGTVTTNKAPLTVTVNDAARPFNTANPPFTATYTGLRLADTSAVVNNLTLGTPGVAQTAAPGVYPNAIVSTTTPTATNYDVTVVPGDLTITALPGDVAFGSGAGAPARVNVYTPEGNFKQTIFPTDQRFSDQTGIRVAAADFNGDGVTDVAMGTGPGAATLVTVVDGKTKREMFRVEPFEASFTGGVFVAAGDVNGDGRPDLLITPDQGGGPRVQLYTRTATTFTKSADFFGIDDPNFRGGARAAVGDVTADGFGDIVVAAGFGGGPRVSIFDGKALTQSRQFVHPVGDFFIFDGSDAVTLRNGVFIAAGDINGDGYADLVAGGGPGGGPRVFAVDGKSLMQGAGLVPLGNFFGGDPDSRGGIRVAAKDFDGDGRADLIVGAGDGAGSQVNWYKGSDVLAFGTPPSTYIFNAFDDVLNGVYVG